MQAERIPTREEIIARRAKLGMRAHQAVVPVERVWSAAMRHAMRWLAREGADAESGRSHLVHAAARLLIALECELRGAGRDERAG